MSEVRRGGDPPYGPYRLEVPPPTSNGHEKRRRDGAVRRAIRGVPAGMLVAGLLATSAVPRLSWLNLAYFNPWHRPVIVSGLGGVATGASRRGALWTSALAGAITSIVALWIVYVGTRLQNPVLWVERDPVSVMAADLGRLAAYAAPSGAVGAVAGRFARRAVVAIRRRRSQPITRLPGY